MKLQMTRKLSDFGFSQVYGNFRPDISEWDKRHEIKGVLGGAPSSWAATTELNIGKDQILDFLGSSNLLWSKKYLSVDKLAVITEPLVRSAYLRFRSTPLPSVVGAKVTAIDISSHFNSSLSVGIDSLYNNKLIEGKVNSRQYLFSP